MLDTKLEYTPQSQTRLADDVNRANALQALGKLDDAEKLLQACLEDNPFFLPALSSKAECMDAKGNRDSAIELAERAVAVAEWQRPTPPGLNTLLVNLSHYYLSRDPKRAIRCARLALEGDPEDWQALGNLAAGYMNLSRTKVPDERRELLTKGLEAIRASLEKAPRHVHSLVVLGHLLVELRDLDGLRAYMTTTVWPPEVVGPGGVDPNVGLVLILGYIELDQFGKAEELLRPMRRHPELRRLAEGAERRMAERKRELDRPGGVYFYRMLAKGFSAMRKALLLRE
jgi:tetratricopeptide (TPR) repeat protein